MRGFKLQFTEKRNTKATIRYEEMHNIFANASNNEISAYTYFSAKGTILSMWVIVITTLKHGW